MILIVDDQPIFRALFSAALYLGGHETKTAIYGSEAITCILDERPDLIVLDYTLPDMSADDILRWLRTNFGAEPIPVLPTVSTKTERCFATLREFGVCRYLFKPEYSPDLLRELADRTLGNEVLDKHICEITRRRVLVEPVIERIRRRDAAVRAAENWEKLIAQTID